MLIALTDKRLIDEDIIRGFDVPSEPADWQKDIGASVASTVAWWDIGEDSTITLGVGIVGGNKPGDAALADIRRLRHAREEVPLVMMLGALDHGDNARWLTPFDGVSLEDSEFPSMAKNDGAWIVFAEKATGQPVTMFRPDRWRALNARERQAERAV